MRKVFLAGALALIGLAPPAASILAPAAPPPPPGRRRGGAGSSARGGLRCARQAGAVPRADHRQGHAAWRGGVGPR